MRRILYAFAVPVIPVFLLPTQSVATTPFVVVVKLAQVEAPPLSSTSTVGLPVSGISIEAGTDKTTASGKLGDVWTSSDGVSVYHWGVYAKAPFDSTKDDNGYLVTLSGLTSGSSVKIEGGWLIWPATADTELPKQKLCKAAIENMVPGYSWWVAGDTPDEFRFLKVGGKDQELGKTDCNVVLISYDGLENAIEARNKATADAALRQTGKKPLNELIQQRDFLNWWS